MRVDENHRVLRFAGALAAVHLLLNGAHGAAHGNLGIAAPPGSEAFIVLVIIAGPLLGVGLALRWRAVGALTLGLSTFAALVFGLAYHFVIDSADRCDHVGHGSSAGAYQATVVLLAATELLGVATAVRLGRTSAPSRSVGRTGVLLVDGTCVFCNRLVQWILRHDAEGYFRFAHIQGDFARAAFARHRIGVPDLDRVYVLQDEGGPKERILIDGEAARLIYPVILGSAGLVVFFVPMAILNVFYRVFAAVRYRIFGQASSCIVPDADQLQRFIGATAGE